MNKRIAFAHVILQNGERKKREVVEFDEKGNVLTHFPLQEEIPFTEWSNKTYTLSQ